MKVRRVWPIQVAIIIGVLAMYEAASRMNWLDSLTFIPFSKMLINAWKLLLDHVFVTQDLIPSLLLIIACFIGGSILGIFLGVLFWRFPKAYEGVNPYLTVYYAAPAFAIYPVLVSLLGLTPIPIGLLGGLFVVVTMIQQTTTSLSTLPSVYEKVSNSFQLSFWQSLFHIFLPAARPGIFAGLRLSISFAIIGVIATEFILSVQGLGHEISYDYTSFELGPMYGGILIVLAIAIFLVLVMEFIEKKLSD